MTAEVHGAARCRTVLCKKGWRGWSGIGPGACVVNERCKLDQAVYHPIGSSGIEWAQSVGNGRAFEAVN